MTLELSSLGDPARSEYNDEAFIAALHAADSPPSTQEVAARVGCSYSTARRRLSQLHDAGSVNSKNGTYPITWKPGEYIPSVPTSELNPSWRSAPKRWGHSLHTLSPYVGGFPPALANYFIRRFTDVGDVVYDPFAGGGTTPLEAILEDRVAWASDAFEYATILTQAKCNPLATPAFKTYLDTKLNEAKSVDNTDFQLIADDGWLDKSDLLVFFSEYTLNQLLCLREVLKDDTSQKAIYLKAILCGVLHGPSEMFLSLSTRDTFSGSIDYVEEYADEHDLDRPEREIKQSAERKQELVSKDLDTFPTNPEARIRQADATNIDFPDDSVDLVLTSPPYMRVLDYSWNNWLRLWWLGVDRETERDSLTLTSDEDNYRKFVRGTLRELERVLTDDGYAVIVVGDVRKNLANRIEYINTAYLFAEEALKHTNLIPRQIIDDEYDLEHRNFARANQLKYDYSRDQKEEKAMSKLDRCLILSPHKEQLPGPTDLSVPWTDN